MGYGVTGESWGEKRELPLQGRGALVVTSALFGCDVSHIRSNIRAGGHVHSKLAAEVLCSLQQAGE